LFGKSKDSKNKQSKSERDKELKKALAEKCAEMGSEYASHEEEKTEYTILTINGKTLKVKKEEITIPSVTNIGFGNPKK
jgi:predicted ribosome-associated RNA-binding protein Tma20